MTHLLGLALRRSSHILGVRTLVTTKMSRAKNLDGVWPVMLTPFKPITSTDNQPQVDYEALDALTDWYISCGVNGLFSICLSSEMFHLSNEERFQIAKRVCDRAKKRIPVVVGATYEGGVKKQIDFINSIKDFASAAVFITNQICEMDETDEVWLKNAQAIVDATGDIPLGVYETPYPEIRLLTPMIVDWMVSTNRFIYYKCNHSDRGKMTEIIETVNDTPQTQLGFYTGQSMLFKSALAAGANGYSGISLNFFPWLCVWMNNHRDDPRVEKVHNFLLLTDPLQKLKYPTCCKLYLQKYHDLPFHPVSRYNPSKLSETEEWSLGSLNEAMKELCSELDISPVSYPKE
eukprot:TRINITY_DN568_c1_g1_i3.p1 TRINITY_DN568_c1_g1~~TRINITY_DN568_c1_g1_i3.p1  ORF type:complete len:347 (-),score=60.94 TRINITY_DN568_c1_g1_i3:164-1204(-)